MQQLGWIQFSQTFKDKVNSILDLLDQEEGMVDELGLGPIRDAYANLFFPGTSTVQTRAKYFFIVPYLIKDFFLEKGGKSKNLEQYLRDEEHKIIWYLSEKYNHDRNAGSGVIGITKRKNQMLARRPSSIYWNGLREFHFIETSLSLSEYLINANKILEGLIVYKRKFQDEVADDKDREFIDNHKIKVSTYQKGWKDSLDLPLSYEEADFFLKRIHVYFPDRLIGRIAMIDKLRESFLTVKDFDSFAKLALQEKIDYKLKTQIIQAHDLDIISQGLHFAYSHLINQKFHSNSSHLGEYEKWSETVHMQLISLDTLTPEAIQETTKIESGSLLSFFNSILILIKNHNTNIESVAGLIVNQEQKIKGKKARLRASAKVDFKPGEVKSLSHLNYRDGNARILVRDIFNALKQ